MFSILLSTFFLPAYAARTRDPRKALWSLLGTLFLVEICYGFFLYLIYPRMV